MLTKLDGLLPIFVWFISTIVGLINQSNVHMFIRGPTTSHSCVVKLYCITKRLPKMYWLQNANPTFCERLFRNTFAIPNSYPNTCTSQISNLVKAMAVGHFLTKWFNQLSNRLMIRWWFYVMVILKSQHYNKCLIFLFDIQEPLFVDYRHY